MQDDSIIIIHKVTIVSTRKLSEIKSEVPVEFTIRSHLDVHLCEWVHMHMSNLVTMCVYEVTLHRC